MRAYVQRSLAGRQAGTNMCAVLYNRRDCLKQPRRRRRRPRLPLSSAARKQQPATFRCRVAVDVVDSAGPLWHYICSEDMRIDKPFVRAASARHRDVNDNFTVLPTYVKFDAPSTTLPHRQLHETSTTMVYARHCVPYAYMVQRV